MTQEPAIVDLIQHIYQFANDSRHRDVTLEHVLYKLLDEGQVIEVLNGLSVDVGALRAGLLSHLQSLPSDLGADDVSVGTQSCLRVTQLCINQFLEKGLEHATPVDLLVSFFNDETSLAVRLLDQYGASGLRRLLKADVKQAYRIGYWAGAVPGVSFTTLATLDNTRGQLGSKTIDQLLPRLTVALSSCTELDHPILVHPDDLMGVDQPFRISQRGSMMWLYSHMGEDQRRNRCLSCTQVLLAFAAGEPQARNYLQGAARWFPKNSLADIVIASKVELDGRPPGGNITSHLVGAVAMAQLIVQSLENDGVKIEDLSEDFYDEQLIALRERWQHMAVQFQM